jgi:methionyl-tRNA formyltransferase
LAAIAAARPDVLVVVAYGRILPRAVLDAAPLGAVNVHASILPAYRGAAPINWAIVHGEAETGVTIMQIDEGLDSGDVLAARRTPIGPRETAPELSARLSEMGAALLAETLPRVAAGTCPRVPQEHARATRAPMLQKEDGILDWGLPATAIDARIRGFDPWPGVHTSWRGQSLAIHDALPGDGHDPGPVPGTVVAVEPAGLLVACGAGMLHVREVTPLGRRRMTARDFANGAHLRPGDRFGA